MPLIQLPAAQVAAGHLPPVCPRHGRSTTETKSVELQSKQPAWAPLLIVAGVIAYLIVVLVLRKTVRATAWPWCAACAVRRAKMLRIGLSVLAASVLLFVGVVNITDPVIGTPLLLLSLAALIAGIIVAGRGTVQAVSGAFVSRDGHLVEIRDGSDEFARALNAAVPSLGAETSYASDTERPSR